MRHLCWRNAYSYFVTVCFFFLCIYFSRKENILSSRCPDICKIFCYFFWMVTGKGLKLYVYRKLYELDELLVIQKYYFYKTRKNVFPNWCKIQSSYKERENTEFHTTVERVIQNNFKVYCHSLCQSLKMFSAPSSTCLVFFFFFIQNHALQEKGFCIRTWLVTVMVAFFS